jgi:hypothetical protein
MTGYEQVLSRTRRSLHGVAELVLAGPQHAESGTIRLRRTPGGFGTVAQPSLRVSGVHVVSPAGVVDLDGRTSATVAEELGVEARSLADVYRGGPGVRPDEILHVDARAASVVAEAFAVGERALRAFAPGESAVLWPEHFDLAIALDEVNYGVSPGDEHIPQPYAYVSPWDLSTLSGGFWNAAFGAARPLAQLNDVRAFFDDGRALVPPPAAPR